MKVITKGHLVKRIRLKSSYEGKSSKLFIQQLEPGDEIIFTLPFWIGNTFEVYNITKGVSTGIKTGLWYQYLLKIDYDEIN